MMIMPVTAQTKRFHIVFKDYQKDNPDSGQIEFAKTLRVNQSTVSRILNGDYPVSRKVTDAIVHKLGYSPSWLINGEGDKRAKKETKTLTEVQMLRTEIDILRSELEAIKARMRSYETKTDKRTV
jgi:transcriptional regulator with XRE-family HTH domain